MAPETNGKSGASKDDLDQVALLLELELKQKRAAWQKAGARYKSIRTASFFFLFIVIIGTLLALLYLFSRVNEERPTPHRPAATASPH